MKKSYINKNNLIKGLILFYFILMFIFPYASYHGASTGLLLWFLNVLPTLLPFIIVSNLMIQLNITKQISKFLYPVFGRLFKVSPMGCYPILVGFLSGIPMGAKSTADLTADNKISFKEGSFLLNMCNNSSPVFIMNFVAINQLKLPRIKYALFAIVYASSIISALLYRFICQRMKASDTNNEALWLKQTTLHATSHKQISFRYDIVDGCIMNGFEVITKIGGYIILFSILAQILNQIIPGSSIAKASFMGILEITTGVSQVCKSNADIQMKIVLAAVLTSFGGLSGMAQTKSVLGNTRLSIKSYFIVKLINIVITMLLALLYITLFYAV